MKNCNKHKGFTLAEVLITLSIIGVIAAILFPSILANYNERTLKAKRQALIGRMSQAMGEMANTFKNYEDVTCTDNNDSMTCTDVGSAAKFVNEGLSKVYKIAAVCDNDSLAACDIPNEIKREDGTTFSLAEFGISMLEFAKGSIVQNSISYPYDTKSIGFMTKNGESILLFYNPLCGSKSTLVTPAQYLIPAESEYCANMIYDLNGAKKKPNKIGEDIGFITVLYNDSPYVVAPKPYDWKSVPDFDTTNNEYGTTERFSSTLSTFAGAKAACSGFGSNVGLPNLEEAKSLQLNRELWAPREAQDEETKTTGTWLWTSSMTASNYVWTWQLQDNKQTTDIQLSARLIEKDDSTERGVRCVYKD